MPKRSRRRRRRNRKPRKHHVAATHHNAHKPQRHQGIGATIGASLGSFAEGAIKSLFGSGDYEEEFAKAGGFGVSENTIVQPMTAQQAPYVQGDDHPTVDLQEMGAMRVRHREFLRDTSSGTSPAVYAQYGLCPTETSTFRWLAAIAHNFEQWIPNGIVFEWVPTCGAAVSSTNSALGTISMATQYNANESPFVDKTALLNHHFATSGRIADTQMHAIECAVGDRPTPILYTRTDDPFALPDEDERLTFLGWTTIWREGSQASFTAGELWVTYDITLLKPRLPATPVSLRLMPIAQAYQALKEKAAARGDSSVSDWSVDDLPERKDDPVMVDLPKGVPPLVEALHAAGADPRTLARYRALTSVESALTPGVLGPARAA